MPRLARLLLGAAVALVAAAPIAPAHASYCVSFKEVCDAGDAACARLATHDQLHQLLCEFG